jgi:hypothetical protein
MVSALERRSRQYGFDSLGTMTDFFSRWIPEPEIADLIRETERGFRPRKNSSQEETLLQKIQKAEFAIVRRLVNRNATIP